MAKINLQQYAKHASESITKEAVNTPAFISAKCAEYATDDFCILNGITDTKLGDIAFTAIHTESEELKAHCTRLITNYPLYKPAGEPAAETEPATTTDKPKKKKAK